MCLCVYINEFMYMCMYVCECIYGEFSSLIDCFFNNILEMISFWLF
jgi:hypothetical protein